MNHSLKPWNTFGIQRNANQIVRAESAQQLLNAWQNATENGEPVLILGEGSNVLFLDDFAGTVIVNRIMGIECKESAESWHLHVGAGENWHHLVQYTLEKGMPGLENLALIPGCAGSSPIQNIGAYGIELKHVCEYVDCIELATGTAKRLTAEQCRFGYRDSIFKRPENKSVFVTYVCFRLSKEERYTLDYGTIRQELEKYPELTLPILRKVIIDIRESKLPDPKVMGNAGSFFMNPIVPKEKLEALQQEYPRIPYYELAEDRVKIPAGWMIDQCGWKGKALGPAAVHDKQALVLVNLGGAKGSDILALSDAVRASVHEKFGIDIHPEVNLIN